MKSFNLSKTIQYDYLIRDKPYYPGTGHAHELHYVWGSTKYDLYRVLMHGLEPEDFEHDLTFLFESQWNRFSHRGEPWINWLPVEENCETLVINKDKVSFLRLKLIFHDTVSSILYQHRSHHQLIAHILSSPVINIRSIYLKLVLRSI